MDLTVSEKATLYFYQWDYQYRGYYHFDSPIDIEIPYSPFYHGNYTQKPIVDDGRVPSLFKSIGNLFLPKPKEIIEEEDKELLPTYIAAEDAPIYVGFSFSFQKGQNILPIANIEFLNMLSFTAYPVSFEILGTKEEIRVQFVCNELDKTRVASHLKAYFPTAILRDIDVESFGFDTKREVAIADFGINDEFVRPIFSAESFAIDPLTSLIATMDALQNDDVVVFQTIFKGITSPLAKDIPYAVSDGQGGSFFGDAPEMPKCAEDKIANPLFSVVMRIATQGNTNNRSQYLAQELARSITSVSASRYNKLIPLSNEGYNYDFHLLNLHHRLSNRLGFILNSKELNTFIHYPNNTVVSDKIGLQGRKTKLLPKQAINQKYALGINQHNGQKAYAGINDETFSKHLVIAGATGTGKTHLLKQLIYADLELRNTAFVIDPHGDLALDILNSIPETQKDNVVYINIDDENYSFGFNIFSTSTDAEKTVLASDLASAFADSWISSGDRIQSVLQKTISTFIYCDKDASILDMKRFLLEQNYRDEFLQTLDDPILQYYWEHEFPLVRRNELSPLLLRIDAFMQTRLLRNVFCQTKGINFKELVEERKLVLIQLSVGLIGLENSKFLARLIISKINQIAFSRQQMAIEKRLPIHLYIDESHNYANSLVVEQILSGARKYNLSLILVLQHFEQVQTHFLNSILTNTATQVFFRQSDKDAKRSAQSFSYFEPEDFMELDRGEALVRINKRSNDFNLTTLPLPEVVSNIETINYIKEKSRTRFAQTKDAITELISNLLPQKKKKSGIIKEEKKEVEKEIKIENKEIESLSISKPKNITAQTKTLTPPSPQEQTDGTNTTTETEKYLKRAEENEVLRKHRSLQNYVRSMALQRGFKATIEQTTDNGGSVDVALVKDDMRIAVEISVTNTINYEVKNIQKCIDSGYHHICMLSESKIHLENIKKRTQGIIGKETAKKIMYLAPEDLLTFIDSLTPQKEPQPKRTRGYRVKSNHIDIASDTSKSKHITLGNIILTSNKKKD